MTETEAKTKWCPMVRAGMNIAWREVMDKDSEQLRHPPGTNCIGSECMMWRWGTIVLTGTMPPDGSIKSDPVPDSTDGYCGLAR